MSPSAANTVTAGKVVSFHYTLRNDSGEVLDRSGGSPLAYLHGAGNIVPGLEREMLGHEVGDAFDVVVAPEEGYGPAASNTRRVIPRQAFGNFDVQPGMQLATETEDGQVVPFWVLAVAPQTVEIDFAHPLAGVALHFSIEIAGVRDATEEEVAHGHPHGPGGAHH